MSIPQSMWLTTWRLSVCNQEMFDFQHCLCVPFLRQMRRPLGPIQTILRPGKNAKIVPSATIVVKVVKISFSTYLVLLIIVSIGIFLRRYVFHLLQLAFPSSCFFSGLSRPHNLSRTSSPFPSLYCCSTYNIKLSILTARPGSRSYLTDSG